MSYLTHVTYHFPNSAPSWSEHFLSFVPPLTLSRPSFLPETHFVFDTVLVPTVEFVLDSQSFKIELINTTGQTKQSPHSYTPIDLAEFKKRLRDIPVSGIDHTGFNLPWFDGVHPEILKLRDLLKNSCLYHEFPKAIADEPWDFILPGTKAEVLGTQKTNYSLSRKPKIEIVSFSKSSIPLVQIDLQLQASYNELLELFPEAIADHSVKSVWVYIENSFGVDVCMVLNKDSGADWSTIFANSRIR